MSTDVYDDTVILGDDDLASDHIFDQFVKATFDTRAKRLYLVKAMLANFERNNPMHEKPVKNDEPLF